MPTLEDIMQDLPIVAIIRGVTPTEVIDVGKAIAKTGIQIIEVPLNSPSPLESINKLADALPDCIVGAGTVVRPEQVDAVHQAGGNIIVSPNMNTSVIKRTVELGMISMPGVLTVSEAFDAYDAGARTLKLFPAGTVGPDFVGAIKTVLPEDAKICAVGGVGADNMSTWCTAGIDGFGIGSEIYKPGMSAGDVENRARRIVAAYRSST